MKRLICIILAVVMCLGTTSLAFAETATYSSTQQFLNALDEEGLRYTLNGLNQNNAEEVTLSFSGSDLSYTLHCLFDEDGDFTVLYVWDLIAFDKSKEEDVIYTCNQLNYQYKYVKFYTETDSTVTAYTDLAYNPDDAGEVLIELLSYMRSIVVLGHDSLKQFDTGA